MALKDRVNVFSFWSLIIFLAMMLLSYMRPQLIGMGEGSVRQNFGYTILIIVPGLIISLIFAINGLKESWTGRDEIGKAKFLLSIVCSGIVVLSWGLGVYLALMHTV